MANYICSQNCTNQNGCNGSSSCNCSCNTGNCQDENTSLGSGANDCTCPCYGCGSCSGDVDTVLGIPCNEFLNLIAIFALILNLLGKNQ